MNQESKETSVCIGRFRFAIPSELVISDRSQSIYRVEMMEMPAPASGEGALWKEKVAELITSATGLGTNSVVLREFEPQPGVRALWYADNPMSPELHKLFAMRVSGGRAIFATRGGEASVHETVETLVRDVLDAYVPGTAYGFCLEEGAITTEPGRNEQTQVAFSHKTMTGLDIEFKTQTVREAEPRTNVEEEKKFVESEGGTFEILRNQRRTQAGLEGDEVASAVGLPGEKPYLDFTWHYGGTPISSTQPSVELSAKAPKERRKELEKIWETILQSLRPVPVAGGAER